MDLSPLLPWIRRGCTLPSARAPSLQVEGPRLHSRLSPSGTADGIGSRQAVPADWVSHRAAQTARAVLRALDPGLESRPAALSYRGVAECHRVDRAAPLPRAY